MGDKVFANVFPDSSSDGGSKPSKNGVKASEVMQNVKNTLQRPGSQQRSSARAGEGGSGRDSVKSIEFSDVDQLARSPEDSDLWQIIMSLAKHKEEKIMCIN